MLRICLVSVISLPLALLVAGEQPWKDKAASDWSDDDAKQVLTESPWAKTAQPTIDRSNTGQQRRGMGRNGGGGIGIGGIGLGMPGGMGRRYPGGGNSGGQYPGGNGDPNGTNDQQQPPELKVRWESALPIREAELKARETNAPTVDEDHYAIAVYGVPDRILNGDTKTIEDHLKKDAAIKRDGKKDLKPSSVELLRRDDGPVIVYLFPKSNEITAKDRRLQFDAKIIRLKFVQSFYVDDMTYQGKLEL